jgi:hypothetical protein
VLDVSADGDGRVNSDRLDVYVGEDEVNDVSYVGGRVEAILIVDSLKRLLPHPPSHLSIPLVLALYSSDYKSTSWKDQQCQLSLTTHEMERR